MLMSIMFYGCGKLTCRVSCYDVDSMLPFASGRVANRRNSKLLLLNRALPVTKFNALYKPFNCGFQVQ